MGTFELLNALVSLIGGGILTIWQQSRADSAAQQRMLLERHAAGEASVTAAREHTPKWKGFYWVRSLIALIVVGYFFIIPGLAVLFLDGVQVVIGYYDTAKGFWPWSSSFEAVTWVKTGASDAERVLVYDPVRNNVMISIIAMYFGNQFARRA